MARRISLREFQESLVRRLAEARTGDRRTLLGVEAGDENWLLDLTDTGEIMPVPPLADVPLTRNWYRGIANVRGTLYGVVDFSGFHGGKTIAPSGLARLLLLNVRHATNSALLFSRTTGLRSPEEFEPDTGPADERPWVAGRVRDLQNRVWLRLDIAKLLGNPQFLEAGAGQS
ncbi:MAG TPA: chemotaxis protein CheW [Rhodocyclaceae bacterium]|jgi:twitching motility protein PilI|nr:chemotaxis protein CheW [Rhodocyclaceae bacterium]HRQ45897.1 chemotaxis protein CheW [Rhodocyclaceae bacterium]